MLTTCLCPGHPQGVVRPFSKAIAPVATYASRNGFPLGKIVGTVLEIRNAVKEWPLLAAVSEHLYPSQERSQQDLWFAVYALLLTWPLLHQLMIDRQQYLDMLKDAEPAARDGKSSAS